MLGCLQQKPSCNRTRKWRAQEKLPRADVRHGLRSRSSQSPKPGKKHTLTALGHAVLTTQHSCLYAT